MALILKLAGQKPWVGPRSGRDVLIDVGTGTVLGVLLNDIWEIFQLPGYYADAFTIDKMHWGWDDVIQATVIPILLGFLSVYGRIPHLLAFAIGMPVGLVATKIVEGYFDPLRLQIIPHTTLPPGSSYARGFQANPTLNQLRTEEQYSFQANPTLNQLRTPEQYSFQAAPIGSHLRLPQQYGLRSMRFSR